jgi:hypothetical protein
MTSGIQTTEGRFMAYPLSEWLGLVWRSSWLLDVLGAEVDDTQDESWRGCFMKRLYLPAKPSHIGIDVDGLAYPLHRPMARSWQMRGQGLLPGVVLSYRCSGRWHLLRDVKPPGVDI